MMTPPFWTSPAGKGRELGTAGGCANTNVAVETSKTAARQNCLALMNNAFGRASGGQQ